MIKETSNQLKARARGTLLGHYGLPIGASILTTAAIMTLEGLISLVVPKNTAGVLISYLTMLIAAIFSHPSADRVSVSAPQYGPWKKMPS